MGSKTMFSFNIAMGTFSLVCLPSYYFGVKRLQAKEKALNLMMKANEFEPMEDANETPVDEDHPFLKPVSKDQSNGLDKEFHLYRKERKKWEKQSPAEEEFQEVRRNGK